MGVEKLKESPSGARTISLNLYKHLYRCVKCKYHQVTFVRFEFALDGGVYLDEALQMCHIIKFLDSFTQGRQREQQQLSLLRAPPFLGIAC